MTWQRRFVVLAGIAALAVGVAEVTVGVFPPVDGVFAYPVGLVALWLAYLAARPRWRDRTVEADTPDPELAAASPPPGVDLEEALLNAPDVRQDRRAHRVRGGLRDVATGVLARYTNLDRETARERVDAGDWTGNEVATRFLGGTAVRSNLRWRLRTYLLGESNYDRHVREAVTAIADIAEMDAPSPPGRGLRALFGGLRPREAAGASTTAGRDRLDDREGAPDDRPTKRWRGVGALVLVAVGVGVLTEAPGIVLAGVVAIGYAAYGRTASAPEPALSVERSVGVSDPDVGDEVRVTVRVENEGGASVSDLRVIDGVPAALAVVDGSPRHATALRPGGSTSFTYGVRAKRGVHEFEDPLTISRDLAGTAERLEPTEATVDRLVCRPPLRDVEAPVPLREHLKLGGGRVPTSIGGSGVEFYATREYRVGDPLDRVDWNRRARSGEFATLEFREERAGTIVLVVDAREVAYRSPSGEEHAVDRCVDGAGRVGASLLSEGHRVGFTTLGPRDCWLSPDAGPDQRTRLHDLLSTDEAVSSLPPSETVDEFTWRRRLRRRIPGDAQLLVFTPLTDRESARLVHEFEFHGYPVTAVSPDPTASETPGEAIARIGRRCRVTDLRRAGIPVVDWRWDDSLETTLERYGVMDR